MTRPIRTPSPVAFSLIEVLVVIGIIGLLAALAVPALSSMGKARTATDAAYSITGAVELARAEAISRKTFVWLGLQTNRSTSGTPQVSMGLVFSRDGTANVDRINLQPLNRVIVLDQVGLFPPSISPRDPTAVTGQQPGVDFTVGGQLFSQAILTFTPEGEVTTNATPSATQGFTPMVGVGLRAMSGDVPDHDNPVDVVIDGSTGLPSIHRP